VVRQDDVVRVPAALRLSQAPAGLLGQDRVDVAGPLGVVEIAAGRRPGLHGVDHFVEVSGDRLPHRRVHQQADAEHDELAVEPVERAAVPRRPGERAAEVAKLREQKR
jgi:hypothetical protein